MLSVPRSLFVKRLTWRGVDRLQQPRLVLSKRAFHPKWKQSQSFSSPPSLVPRKREPTKEAKDGQAAQSPMAQAVRPSHPISEESIRRGFFSREGGVREVRKYRPNDDRARKESTHAATLQLVTPGGGRPSRPGEQMSPDIKFVIELMEV